MDTQICESDAYQRVFQYLRCYSCGGNLDKLKFNETTESPYDCLEKLLNFCGVSDPSWAEICYFVTFLDLQLQSCEESVFTNPSLVGEELAGFKGFVVKFMIKMSRDFSTSSLKGEVAKENSEILAPSDDLSIYEIHDRKKWEHSPHPYLFFNKDGATITFVGFVIKLDRHVGNLINPYDNSLLEKSIITKKLYDGLKVNRVNFQDNSQHWSKKDMIMKLSTVMGLDTSNLHDPDETYVLTVDNVIKILAIQMRFRCDIPVVIMGETGCGKTRLIRYMCDLARQKKDANNMLIMKVHGGKTEAHIKAFIESASIKAAENAEEGLDTVVFFDEANTTDAIDLIKEILCDRRLKGVPINDNLKFIAACNPYRKHKEEMIARLENAGLGFFVKDDDTQQKLGKIPLRQLVYRVLDLPPSMRPLVYDFGQLNQDTEVDYINQIVQNHIKNHSSLSGHTGYEKPIAYALKSAQEYMRTKEDECSFVSLRDVDRAMMVFEYFYDKMALFGPLMEEWAEQHETDDDIDVLNHTQNSDCITRALILSLSMCYRARLQERDEFDDQISRCFVNPIALKDGSDQFRAEIRRCEEVLLDSMVVGDNIARNAALRENVFMMAISIELKIPLFLVGKPGSSKSLAKAIVNDSMRGKDSKSSLLKGFNEVQILSYQCSQLSTSSSIIKLFKDAKKYQESEKQNKKSFVAVVVLDEVGLAEDSPNLPLKSLHPLLEDGTEGGENEEEFIDSIVDRQDRVAFIGISNWALDPAKMNRGIMVTRNDPSAHELVFSARGICSNEKDDPVRKILEQYFEPLAKAYLCICEKQEREFFGLRDFYSLIKMLYNMCKLSGRHPTWKQLEHAIKRNFGGFESKEFSTFEIFEEHLVKNHLKVTQEPQDFSNELHADLYPDCSRLGLIKSSLSNVEKSWHGENRYALFLTENYAALDILKNFKYLQVKRLDSSKQKVKDEQPFILFGSSFPKDREYTQVCRNINQIKICMETGRTAILLNLENLYESLYDVLNQYYIRHADSRYVDLGLQSHRVRCRVDDNFRLILIAEKKTVYLKFPTPLINRMEKHFVLISSVLEDWQESVLQQFEIWISQYSLPGNSNFKKSDAFIGFQKDTPASVVYHATNLLRQACADCSKPDSDSHISHESLDILRQANLDRTQGLVEQSNLEVWKNAVLCYSKYLILQTAAPDSLFRLKTTALCEEESEIQNIYFQEQHHSSVSDFLHHYIQRNSGDKRLLMQVTTHSQLVSTSDLKRIFNSMKVDGCNFSLLAFDTELDFSNKIGNRFKKRDSEDIQESLVVIQCDSGHVHGDLIACARYRIYDLLARGDEEQITHVLFIIHLPRQLSSSLVGFQGDPWISAHIDDLIPVEANSAIDLDRISVGVSISDIFIGKLDIEAPAGIDVMTNELQESDSLSTGIIDEQESDGVAETSREENLIETTITENLDYELLQEVTVEKNDNISSSEIGEIDASSTEHGVTTERLMTDEISFSLCKQKPMITPFYRRLYRCIQPAASKLKDITRNRSTERVNILVRLIPKDIDCIDESKFHGIIIKYIYVLLREKEELIESEKDWIAQESLNNKSLIEGGTLSNVLSRRIDGAVTKIFAEIISIIDRNCNLSLIDPKKCDATTIKLWLAFFESSQIMQFKFANFINKDISVPGIGARKSCHDFEAKFPYSWLVYDMFMGLWSKVKTSGKNIALMRDQLCESVKQTAIGEVLENYDHDCEIHFQKYLHDFVRIVHTSAQTRVAKFFELIAHSLDALVKNETFCGYNDDDVTLIHQIAALHIIYQLNEGHILRFGQLVRYNASCIVRLTNETVRDSQEMILSVLAAHRALEFLSVELENDAAGIKLHLWLQDFHNSENIIASILNIPSRHHYKKKNEARQKFQLLKAMQLFVEHIMFPHSTIPVAFLRRLYHLLKNDADFLTEKSLTVLQQHLNKTVHDAKKKEVKRTPKRYIEEAEKEEFEKNCHGYFLEVISGLCFGQNELPEQNLIKKLLQIVFVDKQTRMLTYKEKGRKDHKPTIRSLLLQLLLKYRSTHATIYLEQYFDSSRQALSGDFQYLCLMCIQCFEDAMHRECRETESTLSICTSLKDSFQVIINFERYQEITIEYLESVAAIRFHLHIAAEIFNAVGNNSLQGTSDWMELVNQVKILCTDTAVNKTIDNLVAGPGMYFIRVLVRIFGYSNFLNIAKIFQWIVPESLSTSSQQETMDPFIIYNDVAGYATARAEIYDAKVKSDVTDLQESLKDKNIAEYSVVLLAFYQVFTMSNTKERTSLDEEIVEKFDNFFRSNEILTPSMLQLARLFLANAQGGPLAQMKITPELPLSHKILGFIAVHTILVLSCQNKNLILHPFVSMMSNIAALQDAYLPTMIEDPFMEVKKAGGTFYECRNGHPYFVGQCGQPMEVLSCTICSAPIGGTRHTLLKDNKVARNHDTTQKGHILGDPIVRSNTATPERNLSSAAVAIIRAIMHSSLMWFACHHGDYIGDLAKIVKCTVSVHNLAEFFWIHLQKDIEQLSTAIGRSQDEAAILIHHILKKILLENPPTDENIVMKVRLLDTKDARNTWEDLFSAHYIEPVLGDLNELLNSTMKDMVNDTALEQDALLKATYETGPIGGEAMDQHLWTYRQRVSLEHLRLVIQEASRRKEFPILHNFLQLEPKLRATQYLPHIVKLQQHLYDTYNFKLNKADAINCTIEEFINRIPDENSKNEYSRWISGLQQAWALVGQDLKTHGRLPVPESICVPAITGKTSLVYLIPTTTGPGVCTTALVDFLILTHNDFIQRCQANSSRDERSQILWLKNEVPISHIHECHLMDYEDQILTVILSHCHYSLRAGEAHTVTYEFQSLQKHILDKFIYGKPTILSDIPQVGYRTDIHTTDTFEAVRNKVKPQENLDTQTKKEIITEVNAPAALRANLDVVDTILGFLSSGGGKPDVSLGKYVEKVLKMKKGSFSGKAQEYCQLRHIISLWKIFSVELAKLTWLRKQEPFDVVSDEYLKELSDPEKMSLDQCLRAFDLNKLLEALYEFIETSARYYSDNELTWPLTCVLVEEKYSGLQLPDNFGEDFPDTITVAQTVATWKHIVIYQEEAN